MTSRALTSFLLCLLSIWAIEANADDWQKKKAERLKPVTAETAQRIQQAAPESPTATPKKERRVLVFYRCEGFIHTSIPSGNQAIESMGKKTGAYQTDLADSYDVFTPENLARYDAILLNNTTHMRFPTVTHQNAFLDYIAGGGGLVGLHAASDNFGHHPDCRAIVGGQFAGHPWNAGGTWAFQLDDPEHTLNAAFESQGFWHQDEIYQYDPKTFQGTGVLRILVSLDMNQPKVLNQIKDGPRPVPVSWLREAGNGRVFYTNFGHREETFEHPRILRHILDGIQYAMGDLNADATPTAKLPKKTPALAPDQP